MQLYYLKVPLQLIYLFDFIAVVLDTNKWFHATKIIGNETSIVIGSEYY